VTQRHRTERETMPPSCKYTECEQRVSKTADTRTL